jgi:aliphatic nitrilase
VDEYPTIRLAAVQAAPVWLDREATVEKACAFIREAGENGAHIVGFPENYISGYPAWYYYHPAVSPKSLAWAADLFKSAVEVPSDATDRLCEAAREARVYVVMGLNERMPGTTGTVYNTNLFINQYGEIVGKRQKLVPTITERLVHANGAGSTLRAYPSEWGPISTLICGENANPFAVAVMASEYPVVHVSNWPPNFVPKYVPMPDSTLMVARSISYTCKCFVISSCAVNTEEMVDILAVTDEDREILRDQQITGGSAIIAPGGVVLAGPWTGSEEGILYADANLELAVKGRLVHDFAGHYNRPDVLSLHVNDADPALVVRTGAPVVGDGPTRSMAREPDVTSDDDGAEQDMRKD